MTDNLTERVTITLLTGIVSYYFPSALLYEQHFLNVQLSFCLISCNSCYVILVLAGLWYCFLQKTLTICQSSHILNITLLWLFLKKGYLQVCVLKITSCVCVFVWALRAELWKLRYVPTPDCSVGRWSGSCSWGGWKVKVLELLAVCVPHLYSRSTPTILHSCGCAVTGIKSSAFNAKGSEIFLKLISCPMQVFSTTCITSTL